MALFLPVLLLLLLEFALRIAGYGHDTAFFKEHQEAGGEWFLTDNNEFSLRFFPPQLARWPGTFRIPVEKPADVKRVFIFGESAAMGDPQPAYGASRYLEVLLREKFPGRKFEVVNLGITAINSHVILPIAQDCAERGGGDVWIIYMGNNEMVGPFGAATVFGSRAPPRAAVRFNLAARKTRVGQLAVSLLRSLGGRSKNTSWGGMQMFLGNQISPEDSRRETVYKNFSANLRDIVNAGLGSGAKVILSTMSVNLQDCPPFASMSNSNLTSALREELGKLFAQARVLEDGSNYVQAARVFEQAVKIDPQFAEARFRLAQCLARQGKAGPAREHFQQACDSDALPFRADTRINRDIRELAGQLAGTNLVLCDAESALSQAGPMNIAGDESFFEHVHFNFAGNYRLGLAWAEEVVRVLSIQTNASPDWPSQAVCEQRLGLTDWNRLFVLQSVVRRMNSPPLNSQFNNAARLAVVQNQTAALEAGNKQPGAAARAGDLLNDAIRRAPQDESLYEGAANVLEATGYKDQAIAAYRELLKRLPHDFYGNLQIGRLLGEQGRPAEGEPFLETAARLRASLPEGWHELGVVLSAQGKDEAALKCARRALALRPQDPGYMCYAGKMLAKLKRRTEAMEHYQRAIKTRPEFWEARFELAGELARENQVAEAAEQYIEVLRINPRHAVSHVNLGTLLLRMNRMDGAIQHFEQALQIDPNYKEAREYLAQVLAKRAQKP